MGNDPSNREERAGLLEDPAIFLGGMAEMANARIVGGMIKEFEVINEISR